MNTMQPCDPNSPLMKAWTKYKSTPEYANTLKWCPTHSEGSLWAAFVEGFNTRHLSESQEWPAETTGSKTLAEVRPIVSQKEVRPVGSEKKKDVWPCAVCGRTAETAVSRAGDDWCDACSSGRIDVGKKNQPPPTPPVAVEKIARHWHKAYMIRSDLAIEDVLRLACTEATAALSAEVERLKAESIVSIFDEDSLTFIPKEEWERRIKAERDALQSTLELARRENGEFKKDKERLDKLEKFNGDITILTGQSASMATGTWLNPIGKETIFAPKLRQAIDRLDDAAKGKGV